MHSAAHSPERPYLRTMPLVCVSFQRSRSCSRSQYSPCSRHDRRVSFSPCCIPSASNLQFSVVAIFMFATPSRMSGRAMTSGHNAHDRTRSMSRTSLHSPYSAHLTRTSPKKSIARDGLGYASGSQDEPVCGGIQANSCSPQRRPLPRYQKRRVSHTHVNPVASAIRSTYAEEISNTIPILTRRLNSLSLEDCIWEDLVRLIISSLKLKLHNILRLWKMLASRVQETLVLSLCSPWLRSRPPPPFLHFRLPLRN
jgi:hypothetical protein